MSLENEKAELENNKKEYISIYKQQARDILLSAKEDANNIIKEMESEKSNSKKLNSLRNTLNKKINNFGNNETVEPIETKPLSESEILPGAVVFVPSFNKNGTILTHLNQSKKFNIQIDNIKTTLSLSQVTHPKDLHNDSKIMQKKSTVFTPKKVETELNVIGLNIEEANYLVDKFLDNSIMSKLEFVRIVHGKGSGILGKGIQKYLKSHPHVKSFRYGTYGEGEMGVTIVELKK